MKNTNSTPNTLIYIYRERGGLCRLVRIFVFIAVIIFAANSALAQNSGTCGENATWTYNSQTQTLTISGTGKMADYSSKSNNRCPWYNIREDIKTVVINQGITKIGSCAFRLHNIITITIPEGVTEIGQEAFSHCTSLTSATIPNSVKNINLGAFFNCNKLINITIPENVETIGEHAFGYVPNIVYHGNLNDNSRAGWSACSKNGYIEGDFVYADNTKKELRRYFGDDSEVTIPDGVTNIGTDAFIRTYSTIKMPAVTSVIIPESVTSIGRGAFYYCGLISPLVIPQNVTSIGDDAFYGNKNLRCIYFNNDPEKLEMGGQPFSYEQTKLIVSPSTFDIWTEKFEHLLQNGIFSIEGEDFEQDNIIYLLGIDGTAMVSGHTKNLPAEIVIPSTITKDNVVYNVTTIGKEAFYDCDNLTSVTIPEGVTSIGASAFYNCRYLASVNISKGVKRIGIKAFIGSGLKSAIIPEGVTTIGEAVFSYTRITTLSVPESVTSIGEDAFYYAYNLNTVWWYASPEMFRDEFMEPEQIHVPIEALETFNEQYGNKYNFVGDIKSINNADITIAAQTYTGSAITPVVKDGEKTLVEGEDYTITLPEGGCINIGDYTVTLTGEKPYYYQSGEKTFTINAKTLTASNVADIAAQTYTGSALEPAVTVTDGEKTLVEGTDYTITYSDNTNIGTGKVTVTFKGNYSGEVVKEFSINPVTATDDISVNSNIKIWSFEKTIFVENASKEIVIVDMAGRVVKTVKPENSRIEIQLSNSGVYIVKTGLKTQKVSL